MALANHHGVGLSQYTTFYPPPLQIQKKPRRATFHRRLIRRPTYAQHHTDCDHGPLDDIIDKIKGDIWASPPDYCLDTSAFDWTNPLQVPPTWTATPLPVSRIPSDQPLRVRKNRQSHSSTSDSSRGCSMAFSRHTSGMNSDPVTSPPSSVPMWPLLHAATSTEPHSCATAYTGTTADIAEQPLPSKRHSSRLRLFTNGFSRLRRSNTRSSGTAISSTSSNPPEHLETSDEAFGAYAGKTSLRATKLAPIVGQITKHLSSTIQYQHNRKECQLAADSNALPTTLRAAVRILPEVKLLGNSEYQEFEIAIEVEAVLHNRKPLRDSSIDVIFVIDNAYYTSKNCLDNALDAVNNALRYLHAGDRIAVYTTNCTHHPISGTKPDLLWPIRPFSVDTPGKIRELTTSIGECGTQTWQPPRPNPPMADVVIAVAKSLESRKLKDGRTHLILLSPTIHVLHNVSKALPSLHVHHVSPAALPCRSNVLLTASECNDACCKNAFVSNWDSYQSPRSVMQRIIYHARSERPVGEITRVSIDIETKHGCELLECIGIQSISVLRPGQVHTLFARVRVTKSEVQEMTLKSDDDVYDPVLEEPLEQELENAAAVGAVHAHLLDVQVLHQNSLHGAGYWNYSETPLCVTRDVGGSSPPSGSATEVYTRHIFHKFTRLGLAAARTEVDEVLALPPNNSNPVLMAIAHEIDHHEEILQYEVEFRQKLPLCLGSVPIEPSDHEWLTDIWSGKTSRRREQSPSGRQASAAWPTG